MSNYIKQLPTEDLELTVSGISGRNLPTLRYPEVKEPMSGRRGRELANEFREKYFRHLHQIALEKLILESTFIITDYAMAVLDAAVQQIVDRYYGNAGRHPIANAVMKDVSESLIQIMVAEVKSIVENHLRYIGGIL